VLRIKTTYADIIVADGKITYMGRHPSSQQIFELELYDLDEVQVGAEFVINDQVSLGTVISAEEI
jgi:hypothetical protein